MGVPWNEIEVRLAVKEYFRLLGLEDSGEKFIKKEAYAELQKAIFNRSVKSIEYKFQNISAILYKLKLPYLSGLKPAFNYQRLLRLIVLDEIDQLAIPNKEPWEILTDKLVAIKRKEPIKVVGSGTGRYGLTIEKALGLNQNSDKKADFMGIELKTKVGSTLQTLFSRVPSEYVSLNDKNDFFYKYSYYDSKRDRQALYTSISSNGDSLGFVLRANPNSIEVIHGEELVMRYSNRIIEEAMLSKHSQTFFIDVSSIKKEGVEKMSISKAIYCKWPSILNFIDLVNAGKINLDFTLSHKDGKIKDHGFLWRIQPEAIEELYLSKKEITLC